MMEAGTELLTEATKREIDRYLRIRIAATIISVSMIILIGFFSVYYSLIKAEVSKAVGQGMKDNIKTLTDLQYKYGKAQGTLDQALAFGLTKIEEDIKRLGKVELEAVVNNEVAALMVGYDLDAVVAKAIGDRIDLLEEEIDRLSNNSDFLKKEVAKLIRTVVRMQEEIRLLEESRSETPLK